MRPSASGLRYREGACDSSAITGGRVTGETGELMLRLKNPSLSSPLSCSMLGNVRRPRVGGACSDMDEVARCADGRLDSGLGRARCVALEAVREVVASDAVDAEDAVRCCCCEEAEGARAASLARTKSWLTAKARPNDSASTPFRGFSFLKTRVASSADP